MDANEDPRIGLDNISGYLDVELGRCGVGGSRSMYV